MADGKVSEAWMAQKYIKIKMRDFIAYWSNIFKLYVIIKAFIFVD